MLKVALVSCVKRKRAETCPARDLYVSPLFTGMRKFAERHCDSWFILSARYGLLRPETIVRPYEATLKSLGAPGRLAWAKKVCAQLEHALPPKAHVVILAGQRYRAGLLQWLQENGYSIEIPMQGMRLGSQLKWLKKPAARQEAGN